MKDKVCIVTGSSSGIGKVTAIELARTGAKVVIICRNRVKAEAVQAEIREATGNAKVDLIVADLAELSQVHRAAKEFKERYGQLHVLINNAGGINSDHKVTFEGLAYTFAGNYLGPFLLTQLLLDLLKASAPARVVNVRLGSAQPGQNRLQRSPGSAPIQLPESIWPVKVGSDPLHLRAGGPTPWNRCYCQRSSSWPRCL